MNIVTKQSLCDLLNDDIKRQHVIGRALVVLLDHQTQSEQHTQATMLHNNVGFTAFDAKMGTITGEFYKQHRYLMPWMVRKWMQCSNNGTPRIVKYWKQLNQAAEQKRLNSNV